jgi:hypothetical protein
MFRHVTELERVSIDEIEVGDVVEMTNGDLARVTYILRSDTGHVHFDLDIEKPHPSDGPVMTLIAGYTPPADGHIRRVKQAT